MPAAFALNAGRVRDAAEPSVRGKPQDTWHLVTSRELASKSVSKLRARENDSEFHLVLSRTFELKHFFDGTDGERDFISTMTDTAQTRSTTLRCPTCGNAELFYQVQEHAENLVDGDLNHLHLLFADTAFYECYECHTQIPPPEYR